MICEELDTENLHNCHQWNILNRKKKSNNISHYYNHNETLQSWWAFFQMTFQKSTFFLAVWSNTSQDFFFLPQSKQILPKSVLLYDA